MTFNDFGPAALVVVSPELGLLVFTPTFDDTADSAAWDAAVLEAAKQGLRTGFGYPLLAERGTEIYVLS